MDEYKDKKQRKWSDSEKGRKVKVLYSAKRNDYRILLGEISGRAERGCEV